MAADQFPDFTQIEPGTLVVLRYRKYNDFPHWVEPLRFLGVDELGAWLFRPKGSFISRPDGAAFTDADEIIAVPSSVDHVATLRPETMIGKFSIYVDVATNLSWKLCWFGWELHAIDMDLDVISFEETDGPRTAIKDQDEFAEHRVEFGYPAELVTEMETAADRILTQVLAAEGAFDGRAGRWLAKARDEAAEWDTAE
ncbi:hypothetical protein [Psychromicrobium lacuslunae]|uniref:hypothetical protein n=1 Tax=Psychromicrobium lacuslunae TaxID=1618207 RepID=UPI00069708C1|nr:hypothetical protein [Psychromicrobium lacuslunae]